MTTTSKSGDAVRRELGHPIIDADGHLVELTDTALPYLREHLSAADFQRFVDRGFPLAAGLAARTRGERLASRAPQSAWWGQHTRNVRDRATAMFPGLLHERLPEIGIDFALLFTTSAMGVLAVGDEDMRRGLCAGWNAYLAQLNEPYTDRLAFAGLVPMHSPDEAIAEMRHCAELGLKLVAFPEGVLRRIPKPDSVDASPFLWPGQTHWFDTFGLDSAHDYDPVWEEARRLGYPVAFHGGLGLKPGVWTSISNYSYNHIGLFAQLMSALCKSLYFGGVTRRFPRHPFVFLECGVAWGAQMIGDIVEHWEKRRVSSLDALDPANLDVDELRRYFDTYGKDLDVLLEGRDVAQVLDGLRHSPTPEDLDDWRLLAADDEATVVDAFADPFYFGCEADDGGVAQAFSPALPCGRPLKPIFSSDIGHWDVTDIAGVVPESYELVEDGAITPEQYSAFVFGNAAEMLHRANPRFFEGTAVAPALPPGSPS